MLRVMLTRATLSVSVPDTIYKRNKSPAAYQLIGGNALTQKEVSEIN